MLRIDTRGRSCPEPVLLTKKAIGNTITEVEVLVDNTTAMQNVIKFLKSSGFGKIESNLLGEDTLITANK